MRFNGTDTWMHSKMSRRLFVLTSISFSVLGYGYIGFDFAEMNMWVRVGWGGLYFTILMLGFSVAWFLVRHAPDAVRKSAPNRDSRATCNERNLAGAGIDRRVFLKMTFNLGLMMVSGAMTVAGVCAGEQRPEITQIAVPLQNLPDELQGFRIVQISDLHLNTTTSVKWLQDIVAQANSLSPDMVAFTGDFADNLLADLAVVLEPINGRSSRFGNYFVTGNHEYSYGHGILREGGVQPWKRKVENIGFNVLLNENRLLTIGAGRRDGL